MEFVPPLNGDLGNPARPHVNADLGAGVDGSEPDATGYQAIMMELVNAILGAGLVPAGGDLTQLWQAIQAAVTGAAGGKVDKAGDTMTGALIVALAALQLTLRHSDNTAALKDHLRLFRGTGAGTRLSIQSLGDAANGLSELDINFLSAVDAVVKAFKFKNSGRLELGADPSLALEAATKQYVDGLLSTEASLTEVQALTVTGKYVSPAKLGGLVATTTQKGIQANATAAQARAKSSTSNGLTASNLADLYTDSALFSLTLGSAGVLAHGLGVRPIRAAFFIVCQVADATYAIGEQVEIYMDDQAAQMRNAQAYTIDATNSGYVIGQNNFIVMSKTTFLGLSITLSSWKGFIRNYVI